MLSETELNRAIGIAKLGYEKARKALFEIESDHDNGFINDPEGHERMEAETKRLRGIYYTLAALAGASPDGWIKKLITDTYIDMIGAYDRVKELDIDHPRFTEFKIEANCRSNIFWALIFAKQGDYLKVLDEINRSFLN